MGQGKEAGVGWARRTRSREKVGEGLFASLLSGTTSSQGKQGIQYLFEFHNLSTVQITNRAEKIYTNRLEKVEIYV